ncbi:hypothetical protein GCM10011365_09700 [Marinicella pacifica]|uniref:Uncharacterized protein n=1 Tax=Marinicella pacifica TaxID=1171543 RepID=A0A917CJD4_9GAMM|nr:hypothetical protein [Marinicella pacifica]GGF90642.1 hypothetical protein GCM10011365_09700 [Marinicella pacifica]
MLTLLLATGVCAQNKSLSRLVEASLQEVNTAKQQVVFNNQRYRYEPDLKNALYQDEDAGKRLDIYDLKEGETYFFNLYQSNTDRNDQFKLIFIAKEPQAE